MKPRKTSYEKIRELIQLSPNAATMKTALRHFGDDALLRELQRRDAMPSAEDVGHFGDSELIAECLDRDLCVISPRELKAAIDAKDWSAVEQIYWEAN